MVKKIILIVSLLMVACVPVVLGDAAPAPTAALREYIDIKIEIETPAIELGGILKADITITNLSSDCIKPLRIDFNGIIDSENLYITNDDGENERIVLQPYETIVISIEKIVNDYNLDWYKNDDGFYVDLQPYAEYGVVDKNDNWEYYSHKCTDSIPLKIQNLQDGSHIIDLQWVDDRDTLYGHGYSYRDDFGNSGYGYSFVGCYHIICSNIGTVTVDNLKPNKVKLIDEYFNASSSVPDGIITISYRKEFKIDEKYYCVEISRNYTIKLLQKPNIEIEINPLYFDGDDYAAYYEVIVTNLSNKPIEDLYIITAKYLWKIDDETHYNTISLDANESWRTECGYTKDKGMEAIRICYMIDGMYHFLERTFYDGVSSNTIIDSEWFDNAYFQSFDYEYEKETKEQYKNEESEKPSPTPAPTPTVTITVTNRRNPMLIAYIVIGVLMAGAVVMIVLSLKRIIKHKNEENND